MTTEEMKRVLAILKANKLAVLSTVNDSRLIAQSALVAFAELPTLEIVFQTFAGSRKFTNLATNNAVSLVIGWDLEVYRTLQYEGHAQCIPTNQAWKYHYAFMQKDSPSNRAFLNDPRARFFRIEPSWLRYSDYGCEETNVFEYSF